jgi:hypothetical protein
MMKSIWWEKKEYKFSRNYKQRVGVHWTGFGRSGKLYFFEIGVAEPENIKERWVAADDTGGIGGCSRQDTQEI